MNRELKPCPFCGSEAVETYNMSYLFQIYCSNDECILNELIMTGMQTEEEAAEVWNKRYERGGR